MAVLPRGYGSAAEDPPDEALSAQQERQYERLIYSETFRRKCAALAKQARDLNDEVRDATAVYGPGSDDPAMALYGNDLLESAIRYLEELAGDAPEPVSTARAWA